MLQFRVWQAVSGLMLLASAGCTDSGGDASTDELGGTQQTTLTQSSALLAASPLPGTAARTVLHDELNEGENLFFTEEGRLFVSGAEDIFEIERAADGTFTKTDHFDEDCIVEGIVQSGNYLYGVCWNLSGRAAFIAGELTDSPVFRIIAELDKSTIPNGMTVDPEGRIYVTDSIPNRILRLTLASPLELGTKEVWASNLPAVNGIKYLDGAMYVTLVNSSLASELVRVPVLPDGGAGKPEKLYQRSLTVLDDLIPFESGFIITDFLKGTLIFWDQQRGVYAETPRQTFFGPTSLVQGRPPMFTDKQLIVAEKGAFLIRNEKRGDLLSMYQLR